MKLNYKHAIAALVSVVSIQYSTSASAVTLEECEARSAALEQSEAYIRQIVIENFRGTRYLQARLIQVRRNFIHARQRLQVECYAQIQQ